MKNVQARWVGEQAKNSWKDYGDVTHVNAAIRHAEFFDRGGMVETRWEDNPKSTGLITVVLKKVARAIPHRGD